MLQGVRVRTWPGTVLLCAPGMAAGAGARGPGPVVLRHGSRRVTVELRPDATVPAGEIRIPAAVAEELLWVPGIPYDLWWDGHELRFGPVLAVVVPGRHIARARGGAWSCWAGVYPRLRGLLFVTSKEKLDLTEGCARGYYYRPGPDGGAWWRGRFPLPEVLYRRAWLPFPLYRELPRLGVRLFDGECNDKWRVYRWLSAARAVIPYLPWTVPVARPEEVPGLVRHHGRLVLKRRRGLQGKGFLVISADPEGGYRVRDRGEPAAHHCPSQQDLLDCLRPVLGKHRYLAQQAVELPSYLDRPMDLRVIMQRDDRGRWRCTGGAARFGTPGAVASNFVWEGGFGCSPVNGLRLALGIGKPVARALWAKVRAVARRVCQAMELWGEFGDLGLDMAVDRQGRIWLLEVNCGLQVHTLALFGGGEAAVRRVRQVPRLYARFLAGWPPSRP